MQETRYSSALTVDWAKMDGLVPAIIQDATTKDILMQGYMNEAALDETLETEKVTFFSRSKQRLWTKGETSGNYLRLVSIKSDCDHDSLIIQVNPVGPVCHTGSDTCFGNRTAKGFVYRLQEIQAERVDSNAEGSYTRALWDKGMNKVAQKVGEEAVELVIEAKDENLDLFENEAADLLYHYLLLLRKKGSSLERIEEILLERSR
ncbi:bifunctional phosphoribosyl-AMP cyclohydrolase/phosphoribosyl-ATP diphosphatase HisIE [Sanyastnella coralliicola]|uniref:bifunctional phosphoribosyl-AMP cyclohydrolase/phosphoribosyl-ATP diphosphatase HisIE n=1 Tax=Sanyastnella coralliicola TaxID=3069118 RepID=UPI0027BA66D2|nr:bifunctional phosphoribosyl-AMP cyclohydrolase/phosphoribosyl-ATP diphosphatase HisIE [Longitalea sp. SCSIO 12813]